MTLWRTTRNEVAGAWRSLQYDLGVPGRHRRPPRPRRFVTATALGTLAVAGAAGSYLAVANGTGALAGDEAGAEPYPLAVAPGDPREGLGRVPIPRPAAVETQILVLPTATTPATPPATRPAATEQPTSEPVPEPCDCLITPPVPTPTAPTPSESPGEGDWEEPAEPGPSPSVEPEPSDQVTAPPVPDPTMPAPTMPAPTMPAPTSTLPTDTTSPVLPR